MVVGAGLFSSAAEQRAVSGCGRQSCPGCGQSGCGSRDVGGSPWHI